MTASFHYYSKFVFYQRGQHLKMADNDEHSDHHDHSYSANSDDESYNEKEVDRDEVQEIWRLIVTLVLLLTAFAVTFTTFTLLQQQDHQHFMTAVGNDLCL
jgi:hypothetical protein